MENESKIVYILRSNPVNPDPRVEKEAYTLKKHGYDVRVLAWDRDTNNRLRKGWLLVGDQRVPITRLGYKATYGEGFKNILPFLKFQLAMRHFLYTEQFSVVHACDFDTAFFSYGVARQKHAKYVFDLFDFLQSNPKNFFERGVHRAVYYLISHSDATIICTEQRKQQIAGSRPVRLEVIHNSPLAPPQDIRVSSKRESTSHIKVVYVGILQDYRLLREMGAFFEKHPEYEWHVAGFGKLQSFFEQLDNRCENVFFYGKIPYHSTLQLELNADIMLAIYDPAVPNHRFAAPNKFYESLMLGKPIIMARGTGISEIVEQEDIGVLIDYSEAGFGRGIEELCARRAEWPRMSRDMKALYKNYYNWEEMERRLIGLYDSL